VQIANVKQEGLNITRQAAVTGKNVKMCVERYRKFWNSTRHINLNKTAGFFPQVSFMGLIYSTSQYKSLLVNCRARI